MDTQPQKEFKPVSTMTTPAVEKEMRVEDGQKLVKVQQRPALKVDTQSAAYTIQVASFQKEQYAQAALEKLKAAGHPGWIATKDLNEKGIWHRVYIGSFQSKAEALDYRLKIKDDYPDSLILSLK